METARQFWDDVLSNKSVHTARIYRNALGAFIEWAGFESLEELYNFQETALSGSDRRLRLSLGNKVMAYRKWMEDAKGFSSSHSYQAVKAMRSFLKANALELPFADANAVNVSYVGQNIATPTQVRQLLDATGDYRNKAIILALKDSGMRVSDIVKINVGDIQEALASNDEFAIVSIIQKKTGTSAKPIFGPEALTAIKRWLNQRQENISHIDSSDPLFTKIEGEGKYQERMKSDTVSNVVLRIARKAGLNSISAHSLRKTNQTFLQAGGMPETWIALVQGRKIRDSRAAYVKPTDEMLIEAYKDAYDRLRIYEEKILDAEEVDMLKLQVSELQDQMDEYRKILKLIYDNPELAEKLKQA